jgi:hypothetical protein
MWKLRGSIWAVESLEEARKETIMQDTVCFWLPASILRKTFFGPAAMGQA